MTHSTPYVKCYVNPTSLGLEPSSIWREAYIIAVTTLLNRPILWTVHLSTGAVWARLPTHALSPVPSPKREIPFVTDPWGAIASTSQVVRIDYLKDYEVIDIKTNHFGRYLFSIDFHDTAFAEDPEQHKILHLLQFDNYFALRPNNMVRFVDEHFVNRDEQLPNYKRTNKYYLIGEE